MDNRALQDNLVSQDKWALQDLKASVDLMVTLVKQDLLVWRVPREMRVL